MCGFASDRQETLSGARDVYHGARGRIGGQMRGNDATLRAERRTEVNAVSSTRAKTVAMGGE